MVKPLDKVTKDHFTAHMWQLGFLPLSGLSSSSMSLLEKQQLENCPWLWFNDLIPTDLNGRDWFGAVFAILLQSTHRMQGVFINQDYSKIKEFFCLNITLGWSLSLGWSNPTLIILHSCFIPCKELKALPNLSFELWREKAELLRKGVGALNLSNSIFLTGVFGHECIISINGTEC